LPESNLPKLRRTRAYSRKSPVR